MVAPPAPRPKEAPSPATVGSSEAQRQTRYNHLTGRLRSRQITMEEATELFALMQAMLRAAEARAQAAPAGPTRVERLPPVAQGGPSRAAAPSAPDDMFLVGLLAMGAGAGLLAAMARRLAEGPLPRGGSTPDTRGHRDG